MSRDPQRLADYLDHVLQAIDRVQRYVGAVGADEFMRDQMVQDAVIRNLEVIGEASHNIETRFPAFVRGPSPKI